MKNQFESIQSWIPFILETIKKEIKHEHLPASPVFVRTHFGNRPLNRLKIEEIFTAYEKDLLAGDESLAEWVVNRWVFRHGDIYSHFAERLGEISDDYSTLESLTEAQSEQVLKGAKDRFNAADIYLFSLLNAVVFPESIFARLKSEAELEKRREIKKTEEKVEIQNWEQEIAQYQRENSRLHEKYENKVAGLVKKYATDTEALKKQIRSLQQRLQAK